MKYRARIVAGTALALVMTAGNATASPTGVPMAADTPHLLNTSGHGPMIVAQAEEQPTEEELLRRQQQEQQGEQPADEAAPAEEAPPAAEEAPAAAEEAAPPAEEAPAEPAPAEPAPAEEAPPAEAPAPAEEAPAAEQAPAPSSDGEAAPADPAPAEEAPAAEEPAPAPTDGGTPPDGEAPAPAEPAPAEPAPTPEPAPAEEPAQAPADESAPAPAGEAPAAEEPAPAEEAPAAEDAAPAEEGAAPTPTPAPTEPAPEEGAQPADEAEPADGAAPEEAPILDSQKEQPAPEGEGQQQPAQGEQPAQEQPAADGQPAEQQPAEAGPPPASDAEAQTLSEPVEIVPVMEEQGQRIERREIQRREGADILREIGDRVVIELNNQVIVESDDRDRLGRDARDVYYEELPRGRVRETIVRPNGVQVVTVRNRYGDIVRRSRITPDGREYVLVYAGERDRDRDRDGPRGWRDPGRDLPPLRLTIPRDEYILDAERVEDPDVYYRFLDQPPVERVERLYTIDEVKYSARVRDTVRRIDLDTITFDFGSSSIPESEIQRLEGVATAMGRMLEENPAETFLIEGHTDAVGSDIANLALSDQRAEAVAAALTNVFAIPPENLVTQGYGEQYLKIDTQDPARENRRVAMRRITPLVSPVASTQQ